VVTAPGPDNTSHCEFHQKDELEKACLEEAGRRFTQAQYTPLLSPPLLQIFGECGNAKEVTRVLSGTFISPIPCDGFANRFLASVAKTPQVVDCIMRTAAEYCNGWRKVRETTSSSVSGIHFGHYIAGTFNPEIMVINAALADIPLQTGFSYQRWQTGLNIMIEKTMGDFNDEKLHIILLFEADFNSNNKWIGWAVMYQAGKTSFWLTNNMGVGNLNRRSTSA